MSLFRVIIVMLIINLYMFSSLFADSKNSDFKNSTMAEFELILRAGYATSGNLEKFHKLADSNLDVVGQANGNYSFDADSFYNTYTRLRGNELVLREGELFTYRGNTSVLYKGMDLYDFLDTYGISLGLFSWRALKKMSGERITYVKVSESTKWEIEHYRGRATCILLNVGKFEFDSNSEELISWSYEGRNCQFAIETIGKLNLFILKFPHNDQVLVKVSGIHSLNPLFSAIASGKTENISFLLKSGASLIPDPNETAMAVAVKSGQIVSAEILLKNGVDVNIYDAFGRTGLHIAGKYNNSEFAEFLLKNGANINQKDNNGVSPLMYGAQNKNGSIVKLFLKNGASIDEQDKNFRTALMYAAQSGNYYPLRELIEAGANQDLMDSNSRTAEDLAIAEAKGFYRWNSSRPFFEFNLASSNFTSKGYSSSFCGGLGFGYNINLAYKLFLQLKITYDYRASYEKVNSMYDTGLQPNYDLNFLELTPTIKYVFEMGLSGRGGFYVLGGAGIQYLIAAKLLDSTDEDDSSIDILKNSDKILYAINSGVGFGNNTVFVELRYSYGLPAVINDIKTSVNTMSVNFGFGW